MQVTAATARFTRRKFAQRHVQRWGLQLKATTLNSIQVCLDSPVCTGFQLREALKKFMTNNLPQASELFLPCVINETFWATFSVSREKAFP